MRRALLATLILGLSGLFAACAPAAGSQLTGTTWQLSAYTEKVPAFQGVLPAEQQPHFTILFNSDSTFSATADCNQVAGTYTTSGSNITITPGPSTMAFCGEESLDAIYTHMLSTATSYAIANNQLTLTLASDGTLVFNSATGSPAPADSPAVAESPASADPAATPRPPPPRPRVRSTSPDDRLGAGAHPCPANPAGSRSRSLVLAFRLRTVVRSCGDAWFRQGLVVREREPRCRQASLNRRQNEVTANKQPALALAA